MIAEDLKIRALSDGIETPLPKSEAYSKTEKYFAFSVLRVSHD